MPKYYVKSGDIRYIIDSISPISAATAALAHYKNSKAISGPKICVGECGFESYKTWTCYDTDKLLKQL